MKEFEELLQRAKSLDLSDANEAETRKKVIDAIFEHILGWDLLSDVKYEENVKEDGSGTYADYHLLTANSEIIAEAKRIGDTFTLPLNKHRKFAIIKLMKEPGVSPHIIQVREYCRKLSIPFAILTNGTQWLVFPGSRTDGVPWEQSEVVAFYSLEDILGIEKANFCDLLSREAVIGGSLEREFMGRKEDQIDSRRLKSFYHNVANRPTNPIYPLLEDSVSVAFSESIAEQDEDLLEKCYVKTPDRTRFDNKLDLQIVKRRSLFSESPIRPMKSADSEKTQALLRNAKISRPLAVMVLGSVGSGKTTFLQHTRKVSLKSYFVDDGRQLPPLWVDVDFRDYDNSRSPSDFIYQKLHAYIISNPSLFEYDRVISQAYKPDIDSLKTGPLKLLSKDSDAINLRIVNMLESEYRDHHRYVDKLLGYYATRAPIFLVIDNLDQIESEEFQSELFRIAVAFARKLVLNLIVSMRETTYVNHKSSPVFDAFDFDPVQIDPPEIASVLSKRFAYARTLAKGKKGSFIASNGSHFDVDDLSVFIDLIQKSVLGTEIGSAIAALSTNDVRLALRMTRMFLESGYTDPAKALTIYKSGKPYTMPRHEALRAILLAGQPVYSERASIIANPFDSMLHRSKVEMLRCYILAVMVRMAADTTFEAVQVLEMTENLNKIGFSKQDALIVMRDLAKNRFIQTSSYEEPKIESSIFPTRLGALVINDLITQLAFLECTMMDTFISSEQPWIMLTELSSRIERTRDTVERIELRIQRAKEYYNFLNSQYQPIELEAKRRRLDTHWCFNPFSSKREELNKNLDYVRSSAQVHYGRNA